MPATAAMNFDLLVGKIFNYATNRGVVSLKEKSSAFVLTTISAAMGSTSIVCKTSHFRGQTRGRFDITVTVKGVSVLVATGIFNNRPQNMTASTYTAGTWSNSFG
jgi:uncharacterized protein YhdP